MQPAPMHNSDRSPTYTPGLYKKQHTNTFTFLTNNNTQVTRVTISNENSCYLPLL